MSLAGGGAGWGGNASNPLVLPKWLRSKESACQCRRCERHRFNPWVGKIRWRKKQQPTLALLPGKFHEQRSLVGNSPWGHKEADMTEWLSVGTHTHAHFLCHNKVIILELLSKLNLPPFFHWIDKLYSDMFHRYNEPIWWYFSRIFTLFFLLLSTGYSKDKHITL